jgi:PAS domain S-box-containing protein
MIWSVDRNYRLTFFNDYYRKKIKSRYGLNVKEGDSSIGHVSAQGPDSGDEWKNRYDRVFAGEKLRFELTLADKKGRLETEEVFLNPVPDSDGDVVEVVGISQTVTYKKAAEKKLKDQAAKIQAIFDSTTMMIWSINQNFQIVSYNKVFADQHFKLLGKEVSIGSSFPELLQKHISESAFEDFRSYLQGALMGDKQQFEGKILSKSGKYHWMETFLSPIYSDGNRIKEISCISYEISDKKIIEEQMRESIHEKEVLLQEVHHRVKNNLQVISSILNLQSSYVKDSNSLTILRESQNRIKSMSFIHESLYQTKDFSRIDFCNYVKTLANNLILTYSLEKGSVNLRTDLEQTYLSLDQAIPCGLMANELISNALKYAFDGVKGGEIFVATRDREGRMELEISDNGKGLPSDLDYENSETLGLQLVYTLAEQLDAEVEVSVKNGTKYLINFDKQ